ncbi:hypothetical protein P7L66_05955 (plasmid) [Tistrella mobilis]|uniref:DUF6896 domain-containing protein n=1 Tax=Tistrella mobilis TaxID=171437 RepID=UPI0035567392
MMMGLIVNYLSEVEECLILFEKKFGRRDLVRAWRCGAISQKGLLTNDIVYCMHGVGCVVEYPDHEVDFDFANQDEVGFDAWRLWRYAKQFPNLYPEYQKLAAVEAAIADGLSSGTINRIESKYPGEGNSSLFKLNIIKT